MNKPNTGHRVTLLMSIYHRVNVEELRLCLDSIAAQTRMPEHVVIIKDGPLNADLDALLKSFKQTLSAPVQIVPLGVNQGLIKALNIGLGYCEGEWILRMDADDLALKNRIEDQVNFIKHHPEVDVLGSAMLEFEHDPSKPLRLKPAVVSHDEIKAQLPFRNPINHPTACIRKSLLLKMGGYPDLAFLEDYFLWAKLMAAGAKFHNLEDALLLYRFDAETLRRRGGRLNLINECKLRWWMFNHKLMGPLTLLGVVSLQIILRLAPFHLRRYLWHSSRRKLNNTARL